MVPDLYDLIANPTMVACRFCKGKIHSAFELKKRSDIVMTRVPSLMQNIIDVMSIVFLAKI